MANKVKVPVIMQMEAVECGAASLTMILAYYDKWIPLEQVRTDCGVSRDGSSAKNVLKAARSYGLVAKGYRYEIEDLQNKGKFPCIIHWGFNHFLVLNGFKGNKAYLNDPEQGTVAVDMEEFEDSYTGICMMFAPSETFEPSGKPKSMLDFARKRMKGLGSAVVFSVVITVIASLMEIIEPAFSRIFLAFGRTSHVGAGSVISFPHMVEFFRWYANPVIFYFAENVTTFSLDGNINGFIFTGKFYCVGKEV